VFTARYELSPYIKQIRFVFKGLMLREGPGLIYLTTLSTANVRCHRWQSKWGRSSDGTTPTGKNQSTRTKTCPPQIPRGLAWDQTHAPAVRHRLLTAWAVTRPIWQLIFEVLKVVKMQVAILGYDILVMNVLEESAGSIFKANSAWSNRYFNVISWHLSSCWRQTFKRCF
jgi:hypothetical protein